MLIKEEFRFGHELLVIYDVYDRGLMIYLPQAHEGRSTSILCRAIIVLNQTPTTK